MPRDISEEGLDSWVVGNTEKGDDKQPPRQNQESKFWYAQLAYHDPDWHAMRYSDTETKGSC